MPAGFLLGFMRRWRTSARASARPSAEARPQRMLDPAEQELLRLITVAPSANRHFQQRDLERLIGRDAYEQRVQQLQGLLKVNRFAATLAVHGAAVEAGQLSA